MVDIQSLVINAQFGDTKSQDTSPVAQLESSNAQGESVASLSIRQMADQQRKIARRTQEQ